MRLGCDREMLPEKLLCRGVADMSAVPLHLLVYMYVCGYVFLLLHLPSLLFALISVGGHRGKRRRGMEERESKAAPWQVLACVCVARAGEGCERESLLEKEKGNARTKREGRGVGERKKVGDHVDADAGDVRCVCLVYVCRVFVYWVAMGPGQKLHEERRDERRTRRDEEEGGRCIILFCLPRSPRGLIK